MMFLKCNMAQLSLSQNVNSTSKPILLGNLTQNLVPIDSVEEVDKPVKKGYKPM